MARKIAFLNYKGGVGKTSLIVNTAAALVKAAVEACERYYQAFQFVVWAGKTAKEGMEGAILETVGEA